MHQALQAAFGWEDRHLYRFSLGGSAFDHDSQVFLCRYDAENPELEGDEDALPASQVHLDEALQNPGDQLRYVYDYGDNWDLTLTLEEVMTALGEAPAAALVDGERAAPPEDCGGLTDAEDLARVLHDPARFNAVEIREALNAPPFAMFAAGLDPRAIDLIRRLEGGPVGESLSDRTTQLISKSTTASVDETTEYLSAYLWFLNRAGHAGIPLTAAGYLKPADVEAASKVVPAMGDWYGAHNREVNCLPLLEFRESLQSMGLLRKHKGALLRTRAGALAQRDPVALWDHLATRLSPANDDTFEAHASFLLLIYAGGTQNGSLPLGDVAAALNELGWRHPDHSPVRSYDLYRLPTYSTLINVAKHPRSRADEGRISSGASALARAALRHPN